MALQKDNSLKGNINISYEDLTTDKEHNPLTIKDGSGKVYYANMWAYLGFFFEKIQHKHIGSDYIYIDGMRPDLFIDMYVKKSKVEDFKVIERFVFDTTCYGLQNEMKELYNVHINWFALFGLCEFIKEIINRRLVVLLKPTIRDTLEIIGNRANFGECSFRTKDGKVVNSDTKILLDTIYNSLLENKSEEFFFDKIGRKVDYYTKEYGQIEFVRYLSSFFHHYFDIKRRKNGYITLTEQKIVCCMLPLFRFSPEAVQESRYRQLMSCKYEPADHLFPLNIPGIFETKINLYVEFLTYKQVKDGRINPLEKIHNSYDEFTINMGDAPDLSLLIEIAAGIIGESSFTNQLGNNP